MPGNFGSNPVGAAVDVMGGLQQQDINAAKAPVELQHLKALSRLQTAQAGEAEQRARTSADYLAAMKDFVPQGETTSQKLMSFGMRVAPYQPMMAERAMAHADQAAHREAQRDAQGALADARRAKTAEASLGVLAETYGTLPDAGSPMLPLARMNFVKRMVAAGEPEEQAMAEAKQIEEMLQKGGPDAIKYLHQQGMTAYQQEQARQRERAAQEQAKRNADLQAARQARLELQRTAEERRQRDSDARVKAGAPGGKGGDKGATKYPDSKLVASALGIVKADPDLKAMDGVDQVNAARRIAETAQDLRRTNPAIPWERAQADALEILKKSGQIKTEKGFLDNLTGGEGKKTYRPPAASKPEKLPDDLKGFKAEKDKVYQRGKSLYRLKADGTALERIGDAKEE